MSQGLADTTMPDNVQDEPAKKPFWKSFFGWGGAGLILIAAILAIIIGVIVNSTTTSVPDEALQLVELPGSLWLRALKAVVLPLIISSLIVSMLRLRTQSPGLGPKIMGFTVGYYLLTTLLAVILGLIMANIMLVNNITQIEEGAVSVGKGTEEKAKQIEEEDRTITDQIIGIFENFIPENVVAAMADDKLLAVIVMAVITGALLPGGGETIIGGAAHEVEDVSSKIVWGIIMLAPVGVFFLLLPRVMEISLGTLAQYVGILIGAQAAAMAIQWSIVYPVLYLIVTRRNPFKMLRNFFPAVITALATSSSAATYPVTMRCADSAGIPSEVSRFSLPLGMTINMDGTAIAFPLYIFWMAYSQGDSLAVGDMVMIAVTATLSSIGTAPIPSASLVLLVMIAEGVGVSTQGVFPLIVAIDWMIDRLRTAVNVTGDLYGAAILSKIVNVEGLKLTEDSEDEVAQSTSSDNEQP